MDEITAKVFPIYADKAVFGGNMNWQPIETYNVDEHNNVVLYNQKTGAMYIGRLFVRHGRPIIQFSGGREQVGMPTHWSKLPEPPKERYDRDTIWEDHFGTRKPIRELDDTHIANIIKWFPSSHLRREKDLLDVIKKELVLRGICKRFADAAFIPYKGPDGEWYVNMKKVSNKNR